VELADEISHGQQRLGRLFRRRWAEHGEYESGVIPLEFARYLLLRPEKDPQWREHARQLMDWVKSTPRWPKYIVHGATVTTEQGDGKSFCCNLPNQCCDSHTARLAAVEAFYYAKRILRRTLLN